MRKRNRVKDLFSRLVSSVILLIIDMCLLASCTYAWFYSTIMTGANSMNAGIMLVDLVCNEDYLVHSLGYSYEEIEGFNFNTYTRMVSNTSFNSSPNAHGYPQESYFIITDSEIPVITLNNIEPGQAFPVSFKVCNRGDLAATFSPFFELIPNENLTGLQTLEKEHEASLAELERYPGTPSSDLERDFYLSQRGFLTIEEYEHRKTILESCVGVDGEYNGKTLEDVIKVYNGVSALDINEENYIGTISQILDGDISKFYGYVLPHRAVAKMVAGNDVVFPSNVILCDEEGVEFDVIEGVSEIDNYNLLFYLPEDAGVEYEYASLKMKVGVTASQVEYEYDGLNCMIYDQKLDHLTVDNGLFSFKNDMKDTSIKIFMSFKDSEVLDPEKEIDGWPFIEDYTRYWTVNSPPDDGDISYDAPSINGCQFQYSYDDNTWEDVIVNDETVDGNPLFTDDSAIILEPGKRVYIKNKFINYYLAGKLYDNNDDFLRGVYFKMEEIQNDNNLNNEVEDYDVKVTGNIMYLLSNEGLINSFTPQNNYAFAGLFDGCDLLTDASELYLKPFWLSEGCYMQMFANCTNLLEPPKLNSYSLEKRCYYSMFANCKKLKSAPSLPATELSNGCYQNMFWGCANISSSPSLPAGELKEDCYRAMFAECTNLSYVQSLPSIYLADRCYKNMFVGCEKLTSSPSLPASVLKKECYSGMFAHCFNLLNPPDLNSFRIDEYCYEGMFYKCMSIQTFKELPAYRLSEGCYKSMFENCNNLLSIAPLKGLPAVTLYDYCYQNMFKGCSNLSTSPKIYAYIDTNENLPISSLENMFYNCEDLSNVSIYFIPTSSLLGVTYNWLYGAGLTALNKSVTIYTDNYDALSLIDYRDVSTIPSSWAISTSYY